MKLEKLLALLQAHHVTRFKGKNFEIILDSAATASDVAAANTKAVEAALPPDLRGDDLMNEKKVLEWSAGQSHEQEDPSMPLTGDAPLEH